MTVSAAYNRIELIKYFKEKGISMRIKDNLVKFHKNYENLIKNLKYSIKSI
jgi:hypothetical protein